MSTRLQQRRVAKTSSYTILGTAADLPGTIFTNRGATGSVTFTLPSPNLGIIGWWYEFQVHADQSVIVAAATAGDINTFGNASANNVGFQIATKKVGRRIKVICDGTQWHAAPNGAVDGFCINGTEYVPAFASGLTLANATFTSPSITTPTITGAVQSNAAAQAAGASTEVFSGHVLANNSFVDFFTVTVPNIVAGAAIEIFVTSALGDGDSTDSAMYTVGISRIAGAATKAVVSSKSVVGATAGATGNAVISAQVSANTGGVGAQQTFTVQFKNARSAGAADNHPTFAIARIVNLLAGGITIAAA